MKTFLFIILLPAIALAFVWGILYYLLTKEDNVLEFWNDVFEGLWI